jgi:transcriptional regulator GlxA family with amidase domain
VTSIALRWGFVDASHFSHCFRDAYGMPPRDCRVARA